MNNTKQLLQTIDAVEVVAIELLSKSVAWVAPIVTAILIINALIAEPLSYELWVAVPLAFTIEALGISFMATTVFFFSEWRGRLPASFAFWVSALCVVGYVIVAFPVVTVVKGFPQFEWVVPAGGVLLSMLSGVIVGVRSNWQKHLIINAGGQRPKRKTTQTDRRTRKPPAEQTTEERDANRLLANEARRPTQADYNLAATLKAEGLTWPEVANRLGKAQSTAKEWAKRAESQPVVTNGNGVTQ